MDWRGSRNVPQFATLCSQRLGSRIRPGWPDFDGRGPWQSVGGGQPDNQRVRPPIATPLSLFLAFRCGFWGRRCQVVKPLGIRTTLALAVALRSGWTACWSACRTASSSRCPLPRPSRTAACARHNNFALSVQSIHTLFPLLGLVYVQRHFPLSTPSPRPRTSRTQLFYICSGPGTPSIRIETTSRRPINTPAHCFSLFAAVTTRQHNRRTSQSSLTHHRLDMSH